jgi:hypothetical protein
MTTSHKSRFRKEALSHQHVMSANLKSQEIAESTAPSSLTVYMDALKSCFKAVLDAGQPVHLVLVTASALK